MTKGNRPQDISNRLRTGTALQAWRNQMALSAKELAKLIGVTERTIHRAERTNKLGSKVKLGMELLQSRLAHGEITLPTALKARSRRGRPRKQEALTVSEEPSHYGTHWHGELRTGADLRAWRKSVGLYQKELAMLLGVVAPSVRHAEQSTSPRALFLYSVELLRSKVLSGEVDLCRVTQGRPHRGRPKKD
jgi:transcriptional regulator with XRE-family HTH domain